MSSKFELEKETSEKLHLTTHSLDNIISTKLKENTPVGR